MPGATTVAPTTIAQELAGLPDCPVEALGAASGPVDITFWHAMNTENEQALQLLATKYNESQTKVRVRLINQINYEQSLDKYRASRQADRPELIQLSEDTLETMSSSGSVVPVAACVEAEGYALDDFLEKTIAAYTTRGVLWTMPFNLSNPVLYFNERMFEAAGLDIANPPDTLEELRAAARRSSARERRPMAWRSTRARVRVVGGSWSSGWLRAASSRGQRQRPSGAAGAGLVRRSARR